MKNSERVCFLCGRHGSSYSQIEIHHIFGGAYRKKSTKYGLVVPLCHYCHNEPPNGAHHNKHTMLMLHQYGQKKAMLENDWSVQDFIREFGRNYLDIEVHNENDQD